jgi:uncharacterized protein YacL
MTNPERSQRLDVARTALSALTAAGLGVAIAELFVHYYPRSNEGPTAAALDDAFTWILGACVGLLIGSFAAALLVRTGSRFVAGVVAGVVGFLVGVVPYVLLTAPSDVSFSDSLAFAVIVFAPALVFVTAGAALGVGLRRTPSRGPW